MAKKSFHNTDPDHIADQDLREELCSSIAESYSDFFEDDFDDELESDGDEPEPPRQPPEALLAALERADERLSELQTAYYKVEVQMCIADGIAPYDKKRARSHLERAIEFSDDISDEEDRVRQKGELAKALLERLRAYEAAYEIIRELPPTPRTVRILANNYQRKESDDTRHTEPRYLELAVKMVDRMEDPKDIADAAIKLAYTLSEYVEDSQPPVYLPAEGARWAEMAAEVIPRIKKKPQRDSRLGNLADWFTLVDDYQRAESLVRQIGDKERRLKYFMKEVRGFIGIDQMKYALKYLEAMKKTIEEFDANKPAQLRKQQTWLSKLGECYAVAKMTAEAVQLCERLVDEEDKCSHLWYTIEQASTESSFGRLQPETNPEELLESLIAAISDPETRRPLQQVLENPTCRDTLLKHIADQIKRWNF